jgi:hypothetical protein
MGALKSSDTFKAWRAKESSARLVKAPDPFRAWRSQKSYERLLKTMDKFKTPPGQPLASISNNR